MISDPQFERTRRLSSRLAGLERHERHRELLTYRTRRLGISQSNGINSLLHAAESGDPAAVQQIVRLVMTKFTGFFRHPNHFEIAAEHPGDATGLLNQRAQGVYSQPFSKTRRHMVRTAL